MTLEHSKMQLLPISLMSRSFSNFRMSKSVASLLSSPISVFIYIIFQQHSPCFDFCMFPYTIWLYLEMSCRIASVTCFESPCKMNHFQSLMALMGYHRSFILIGSQLAYWIQTQTLVQWDASPFLLCFYQWWWLKLWAKSRTIKNLLRNPTIDAPHGLYLTIQLIRRSRHNRICIDACTCPWGWKVLDMA